MSGVKRIFSPHPSTRSDGESALVRWASTRLRHLARLLGPPWRWRLIPINLINFEDEFIAADKIANYQPQQNSLGSKLASIWALSPGRAEGRGRCSPSVILPQTASETRGGSYSAIGWSERERYMQVLQRQIDASLLPGERWGFKVQRSGGTSRCLCSAVVSKISARQDTRVV